MEKIQTTETLCSIKKGEMMKDNIVDFLKKFDTHTIITVVSIAGACIWYTGNRFDRIEERLDKRIDDQAKRSDKLYEMFIDLLKEKK